MKWRPDQYGGELQACENNTYYIIYKVDDCAYSFVIQEDKPNTHPYPRTVSTHQTLQEAINAGERMAEQKRAEGLVGEGEREELERAKSVVDKDDFRYSFARAETALASACGYYEAILRGESYHDEAMMLELEDVRDTIEALIKKLGQGGVK